MCVVCVCTSVCAWAYGVCLCVHFVQILCDSDAPLCYYDPRSEFDIEEGTIPYHSSKHKKLKRNLKSKPRSSATITPETFSSCQELKLSASKRAQVFAEKHKKREANSFFKTHGYNSSLNERVENNKSRRIELRLGDDRTRVQQHEKVKQFLKDCSVEGDDGSGIFQWEQKYSNDQISYYLLNALDTATRNAGDLKTALVNAVDLYSAQRLLPVIYGTFKESKYRFVEVDETQEAFVDKFIRKGISAKQVFNSSFASHFLEKILSSSTL